MAEKLRTKQKIAIAGVAIGLTAIAAGIGHVFRGTPRYSLGQLQQAISQKDTAEIEKYLDTEAIASQIVDVSIASVQQQAMKHHNLLGIVGNSLSLVETIRPQVQTQIEKAIAQGLQNLPENNLQGIKLSEIEREGEKAIATFDLSELADNENMPFKSIAIDLQQQSDRQWQITGLSKESLSEIAEFMEQL